MTSRLVPILLTVVAATLCLSVLAPTASAREPVRRSVSAPRPPAEASRAVGGAPRVELGAADVRAGVEQGIGRVRACYERALKGSPELRGTVTVGWRIERDGAAATPTLVADSVGDPAMAACVVSAVGALRFAPSASTTEVEYPFAFQPAW